MKTERAIGVVVLMALAVAASFWLGYHHGSRSMQSRLNTASNLRQIGLAFREGRNDVSRFALTSDVIDRTIQDKRTWIDAPSWKKERP